MPVWLQGARSRCIEEKKEGHSLGIGFAEKACDGSIMRRDVSFGQELKYEHWIMDSMLGLSVRVKKGCHGVGSRL
jgi:hypothetical protein